MLGDVVDLLRCPHCGSSFVLESNGVTCPQGHHFDRARQGHLNLLRGPAGANADTAAMVAARAEFLLAGHYRPIAALVADAAVGLVAVEVGAGTGYYLHHVLDRLGPGSRGIATDVSAYACRRSAKGPRTGAIVADTWAGLPIADGVADTVLAVFAPRNPGEFARICAPGGRVLVVTPMADHLAEVRRARGLMDIEHDKHDRLLASMTTHFSHRESRPLRYDLDLSPHEVDLLIGMGPNAFHADASNASDPAPIRTTVAVRLDVFEPQRWR
ncbi:putative RNA methyltransferase [Ammonicoccus fulvus]|uniref:RNA methyltransferase n=1 Tax=Ammonicoccus fulvus TaxID=3138240 RepID=A0ABZ3FM97_9ACTN